MRLPRRRLGWLAPPVLLVVLVIFHPYWLSALGSFLVLNQEAVPSDCVLVLGGDFYGNRVRFAGELVRRGMAPVAFVSGPTNVYGLPESALAIPFAMKHGYPEDYFVALPNQANSTREEAQILTAELRRRNIRRYLLVTSNYHTRRAASLFRAAAPDLEVRVLAAPDAFFRPEDWWRDREGRKTFLLEWAKTFAAMLGL